MADDQLRRTLAAHGQAHLLDGFDWLGEQERAAFLQQLAAVSWQSWRPSPAPPSAGGGGGAGCAHARRARRPRGRAHRSR